MTVDQTTADRKKLSMGSSASFVPQGCGDARCPPVKATIPWLQILAVVGVAGFLVMD
ncbi:hypothetical protein AAGW05_01610 [Arthrobacter sp. LAPM80]|uniref:hypothetical protein n=1 Tax=Arthrobacter sp. LAPM80 TaxID=3141788 RepID=UPI00398B830B